MTKKLLYYLVASFFLLQGCSSLNQAARRTAAHADHENVKLPVDVVPIKYDLSLWVDPTAKDFSGTVGIDISLLSDRRDILLHAQDMDVMSVNLEGAEGDREAKFETINDQGLARINFGDVLPKGHYRIEIAYRAKFRDDLSGLYKVTEGSDSYLFTQFEPVSARKMFPCFDEPRFKTPFNVKVISPKGQSVIANTPVKNTVDQQNDEVHVFDTTKPLSTYLLAIAVGPFDVVIGPNLAKNRYRSEDIAFRGIATKGKGEKLKLALAETPRIVQQLEEYFGVPYPYQKLDVIAIPDFSAGAMENAGAITFREWYLLLDEKTASQDQRRGFYVVMAHELAHQWFGNSVTMPWWDDLWLNEAFATWLSYKIIDQIKPEFKSAERLLERSQDAMAQDSLASARKIHEPITSHHDIHNAFDSITYSKGGAVLSMLENYLGPAHFRDAVSSHVKRFENKTATSRDFLESLAKFSDPSLVNSAESFLNQTGVPHVKLNFTCEAKGFQIKAEQNRYVPIGSKISSNRTWGIPICVSYEDKGSLKKHCFTMEHATEKIHVASKSCPNFVMPNAHGQGYYRFSLNLEAWKNLLGAQPGLLSDGDRLAIADSLVAELYAGGLDFTFVAEGLHGLIDHNSLALTRPFLKLMKEANNYWVSTENRSRLEGYAQHALKETYKNLSKARDLSSDQISLKKELASFLSNTIRDKEIRLELSALGSSFLRSTDEELDTEMSKHEAYANDDLLSNAVAISMQYADNASLEKIANRLAKTTDTVQRSHILYGLAKSREGGDANSIRSLVFNPNLRRNEQLKLFYDHLESPRNQPDTWQFLKANWEKLKATLSKQQMANLPYLAEGLCDAQAAFEVNQFFSPLIAEYQGGPRTLAEVVEGIEICAARKGHATKLANRFFDTVKVQTVVEREKKGKN